MVPYSTKFSKISLNLFSPTVRAAHSKVVGGSIDDYAPPTWPNSRSNSLCSRRPHFLVLGLQLGVARTKYNETFLQM